MGEQILKPFEWERGSAAMNEARKNFTDEQIERFKRVLTNEYGDPPGLLLYEIPGGGYVALVTEGMSAPVATAYGDTPESALACATRFVLEKIDSGVLGHVSDD